MLLQTFKSVLAASSSRLIYKIASSVVTQRPGQNQEKKRCGWSKDILDQQRMALKVYIKIIIIFFRLIIA